MTTYSWIDFNRWAKETPTAIKPRVQFSNNVFTAENVTSTSVTHPQLESVLKTNQVALIRSKYSDFTFVNGICQCSFSMLKWNVMQKRKF